MTPSPDARKKAKTLMPSPLDLAAIRQRRERLLASPFCATACQDILALLDALEATMKVVEAAQHWEPVKAAAGRWEAELKLSDALAAFRAQVKP